MVNALTRDHNNTIKRLPRSLLLGAKTLSKGRPKKISVPETLIHEAFGVSRVNGHCVELNTYGNTVRNVYASFIGISMVMSVFLSIGILNIIPEPLSWRILLAQIAACSAFIAISVLMYLCVHFLFGKFRGGFIRIHRGTRKLYFVTPRDQRLLTLEWDEIRALAGYIPIVSAGGYTSRYPLYLIATDWTQSPPKEICVSCGNLGWRDGGSSAKELWDYLQIFMEHGADALPQPPPIPPRLSRKETVLRFYRDWADKYRRDLATPKGKRWAILVIPAKILALICIVFPDSLAEFIEYNVPYTSFPKEIDALCGFKEKRVPIMRLNGERIDS
ncbi:hypothetical protein [Achromobacter spanius]|uniref:hypothetical protein n=1 Tax=Achromobacter spanius TaxID=217203 RepID=UPI003F69263B